MARFLLLLCALVASANALLLPVRTPSGPALVQRTRPTFMQAEPPTEDVVGDPEGATEMAPDEKDGYQTYYDDEKVRPMPHSNSCLLFHALFFRAAHTRVLSRFAGAGAANRAVPDDEGQADCRVARPRRGSELEEPVPPGVLWRWRLRHPRRVGRQYVKMRTREGESGEFARAAPH